MFDNKIIAARNMVKWLIKQDSNSEYTPEDVEDKWELGDMYEFLEERDYVWDGYVWEQHNENN